MTATAADWPQMQPLAGASVYAVEWQRTTTTGPDGSYCLEGQPGSITIEVIASGHQTYRLTVSVEAGLVTRNIGLRQQGASRHTSSPGANGRRVARRSGESQGRRQYQRTIKSAWGKLSIIASRQASPNRIRTERPLLRKRLRLRPALERAAQPGWLASQSGD